MTDTTTRSGSQIDTGWGYVSVTVHLGAKDEPYLRPESGPLSASVFIGSTPGVQIYGRDPGAFRKLAAALLEAAYRLDGNGDET